MNKLIIDRMREAAGDLWEQAITHPSGGKENNQHLELLGKEVLNRALADLVNRRCNVREDEHSAISDCLVSDEALNKAGRKIGLGSFLKFEMSTYYQPSDAIVTTGMRGVIGAIHEKSGYDVARGFVEELFVTDEMLKRATESRDSISTLKEWLEGSPWRPKVMAYDEIVDGKQVFYHAIEFSGMSVIGMGSSRMRAEAQASRIMLSRMAAPTTSSELRFVSPSDHRCIDPDQVIDGEDETDLEALSDPHSRTED